MKKKLALALAALLAVSTAACGSSAETAATQTASAEETAAESTAAETETAAEGKKAVLAVSFGTSYNDSRDITIGAVEEALAEAFPDYEVRRAFTSQIIIDKLKERDSLEIDNVTEALDRAAADGIEELYVQPTHLMDGYEYNDVLKELTPYVDQFRKIIVGAPLLTEESDFEAVAKAITEATAEYDDGKTAICFMGHGTEAESNDVYPKLQETLTNGGYENYYIGTVEAAPTLDDVAAALNEKGSYEKVVLQPLMVVAGDHANNDMAGTEEDSWKTVLENEGYEVECIIEGLGQMPAIQDLYAAHLKAAIEADQPFAGVEEAPEAVGELADGVYTIDVESSSSMFKVVKAELTVEGGRMSAVLTLSGTGYEKLYMGTGEEAAGASEEEMIPFAEDAEGAYTYTVPVEALDQPVNCAAFSKKKQQWYDRELTFLSGTAKAAGAEETAEAAAAETETAETEAAEKAAADADALADGVYTAEITFAGGSGKAQILSPVTLKAEGGKLTATVEWNSENYDYMLVDGEKYLPVNTEGNSVFEIPVAALDQELTVIGDTVAMSKPHEVEYTITVHGDSLKTAE